MSTLCRALQFGNLSHQQKGVIMVKHVILWTLKDELSAEEKAKVRPYTKVRSCLDFEI